LVSELLHLSSLTPFGARLVGRSHPGSHPAGVLQVGLGLPLSKGQQVTFGQQTTTASVHFVVLRTRRNYVEINHGSDARFWAFTILTTASYQEP
jgi:hypothetical protein